MNRRIRCIICDDEYLGRQNIRQALSSFPDWEIVAELESGIGLPAMIDRWQPDIIFLDIRMPGRSGIDIMRDIVSQANPPEIIFITAFDQYAIQAFELYALDYILKPFDEQRFAQSIDRAYKAVELNRSFHDSEAAEGRRYLTRLFISSISRIEIVDVSGVYAFVANGNYVDILLERTKRLHRSSLNYLEQNLNPAMFVRCHRSSIARIDKITDLVCLGETRYEVVLGNNAKLKMSSTYKDAVMAALEKGSWK
jgi:two-component system, LytTR family, response regulator